MSFPLIQGIPAVSLKTRIGQGEKDVKKIFKGICNQPLQTTSLVLQVCYCGFLYKLTDILLWSHAVDFHHVFNLWSIIEA